jgi:YbbR domain-containing protein
MKAFRWFGRNLSALILAFLLAIAVWISAVTATDPNQEKVYIVPIEAIGQVPNTEIISELPERMQLTLFAPSSNLDKISRQDDAISAWIDLSGLREGTHNVPVQYQIPADIRPVRTLSATPNQVEITIES